MNNPVNTMEEYLAQFDETEQAVINRIRDRAKECLPKGYEEGILYNMITYYVPLSTYPSGYHVAKGMPLGYFAVAKQKNFYALYHMGYYAKPEIFDDFVKQYKEKYGKLDMGKSCMRFKTEEKIPFDLFDILLSHISVEEYIKFYEDNTTNLPVRKKGNV